MAEASMSVFKIIHLDHDFAVGDLMNVGWNRAEPRLINRYWSGLTAPVGRQFVTHALWSKIALYVRFDTNQKEPLIISNDPDITRKTPWLWDRDVCEIFIAPDRTTPNKYFEFEVAPTGEWLDLAIDSTSGERITDWDFASGMESAARIEEGKVVLAFKISWTAFGMTPTPGDIWLANIFRCVGSGPERGYLAWQPTETLTPDFHVPSKFGEIQFVK